VTVQQDPKRGQLERRTTNSPQRDFHMHRVVACAVGEQEWQRAAAADETADHNEE